MFQEFAALGAELYRVLAAPRRLRAPAAGLFLKRIGTELDRHAICMCFSRTVRLQTRSRRQAMRRQIGWTLAVITLGLPGRCWGWGSEGHRIVAAVAARGLTPNAK